MATSADEKTDALRKAFPGLEGDELEHLIAVARKRSFQTGTLVVREEEAGQTFFVILDGQVEVTKRLDDRAWRVLRRHGPGEFFGEMALIETTPRTATVRTRAGRTSRSTATDLGEGPTSTPTIWRIRGATPTSSMPGIYPEAPTAGAEPTR